MERAAADNVMDDRESGRKPIVRVIHPGNPAIVTAPQTLELAALRPVALRPRLSTGLPFTALRNMQNPGTKDQAAMAHIVEISGLCLNP